MRTAATTVSGQDPTRARRVLAVRCARPSARGRATLPDSCHYRRQRFGHKPMSDLLLPLGGPLIPCRFEERVNRFLVRVRLEEGEVMADAHLADPGRLKELLQPGQRMWVRPAKDPKRKTDWTAVMVEGPGGQERVSLDTTLPNRLIRRALEAGALPEFSGWELSRPEVAIGRSRFDFLLVRPDGRRLLLEVKSVTLVEDGVALFPDAVTARGRRHVSELAELVVSGAWEAGVLFVLQRRGADRIRAARGIDPAFADALETAAQAGVRLLGRRCRVGRGFIQLDDPVPVEIGP